MWKRISETKLWKMQCLIPYSLLVRMNLYYKQNIFLSILINYLYILLHKRYITSSQLKDHSVWIGIWVYYVRPRLKSIKYKLYCESVGRESHRFVCQCDKLNCKILSLYSPLFDTWTSNIFFLLLDNNCSEAHLNYRIVLVHQHGRRFIVLERQYGCHDVKWKPCIQ